MYYLQSWFHDEAIGNSTSLEHAMKQVQDYMAYQVKELEYRKQLLDS